VGAFVAGSGTPLDGTGVAIGLDDGLYGYKTTAMSARRHSIPTMKISLLRSFIGLISGLGETPFSSLTNLSESPEQPQPFCCSPRRSAPAPGRK
jgi:hypothetical protein